MVIDQNARIQFVEEFIIYKNSLGYIYTTQEAYLRRYMAYENEHHPDELLSKECVTAYIDSLLNSAGSIYGTVSVLREFSRYLSAHGCREIYMIPSKIARLPTPASPYFFSNDEIERFFAAVDSIEPHPNYQGREWIIPTLFRLLYCCGIRCKEARILRCQHVCKDGKYIDILQSKGLKSRRVYLGHELSEYLRTYDQQISVVYPQRTYFFPGYHKDKYLSESSVCGNFRRFWNEAFPMFSAETHPRAYDFRHHLAWANINRWAAGGLDVNVMLPYLMRYMGHKSVKSTLYYFHFVPEFFPTYLEIAQVSDDIIPEVSL